MSNQDMLDRAAIREVLESWVLWRDSGNWKALARAWHPGGVMMATWQQSSADDFIASCATGWDNGVDVFHFLGGTSIELAGTRAVAQTKMTISQRALVHDELVDVTCMGRFYDFFEQRDDKWAIVLRQPIYERIGSTRSLPGHASTSTKRCSPDSLRATGTWRISSPSTE